MLMITIELLPKGDTNPDKRQILGRMFIANDGTSTDPYRGNYLATVNRKGKLGTSVVRRIDGKGEVETWWRSPANRVGRVHDFPRKSYSVWRLVLRALRACYPEEKG